MNKTTRRIQFRSHLQTGTGTQIPAGTEIPLVATIEYEEHDPTTLSVDLLLLGKNDVEHGAAFVSLTRPFHFELFLTNDESTARPALIRGIHNISNNGSHVSIEATEARVGFTDHPQENERNWFIKVELTPSGILQTPGIRQLSHTGEISVERIKPGAIEVSTKLGILEVGERYAHYSSEQHGNRVTQSMQRAAITGTLQIAKGESLASFNKALIDEVKDICNILSLCYRQPVDFYEIWYVTDPNTTPDEEMQEATLRRRFHSINKKSDGDELIHRNNMIEGGLDQLIKNYKEAARKTEITRAIRFLAPSHTREPLESAYFLAYSALDLIASTGNAEDAFLLDPSKWRRIQKLLRAYLDSIAEKEEIGPVVNQLKEKLPELRRVSGDKRVIEACRKFGVTTDDLWREEGFEAGLKAATKIRNRLFHAAGGEMDGLYVNLVRVRTLVERLLLGALQWPDERTWVWKDQELLGIES
ncbi:MAG: hypothetical protein M3362_00685 [Acidobacteriota bacterium]|nr:hypothetical protein [Acidobacteriota bacterium]